MNKIKKNFQGSILSYGLVILTISTFLLLSMVQFVVSQIKYSLYNSSREEAFQIAESGIYFYRWYLAHEVEGKTAQQVLDFWNGTPIGVGVAACGEEGDYEKEYKDPSGSVLGKYCLEVTPPEHGSTIVTVKSTGWTYKYPDAKRVIQVRFRKPSWSEYAVLGNDFTGFGSGTEVFGKLKSNGGIRFNGLAHNVVSSGVETVNDPDHGGSDEYGVHTHMAPQENYPPNPLTPRPDIFEVGRKFPVTTSDFNAVQADLNFIRSVAIAGTDGSYYFDSSNQGRHIIFQGNTFDIRKVKAFNANTNQINNYKDGWSTGNPIPDNGVIFVEDNVWLEGHIDGKRVTVVAANLQSASAKSVYLGMGDLTYTNYDGTDVIGIIGQKDIAFVKNSQDILKIDGALLAQTGRFGFWFRNGAGQPNSCIGNSCHWCNACIIPCHKDTITTYGAIATNERYALYIGDYCFTASGFPNRNLNFDNNLIYAPPPYFPTGDKYIIDLWEEM